MDSILLEQKGKYTVRFTTNAGCSGESITELFVKQSVRITSFDLSGDPCSGSNATITLKPNLLPLDNGTYSYFWSGPNGFVSRSNQLNLTGLGAAANGNYQLNVLAANNCLSKTGSFQVKLGERPPKPNAPVSKELGLEACLNTKFVWSTAVFSGIGAVSYHWILPDGRVIETTTPNLEIEKTAFSDAGDYRVFIRHNGCNSDTSPTANLKVKPLPTLTVSHNSPVCAGSPLRLNASSFDGAIYKWIGPNNFSSNNAGVEISQTQKGINEGNYSVIMTLNGCTTAPVVIPVTVLPAVVLPTLEPLGDICTNKQTGISLKINANNYLEGATYIWYADGIPIDSGRQSSAIIQHLTPYIGKSVVFSVKQKGANCATEPNALSPITISAIPNERATVDENSSICAANIIYIKAQATAISTGKWRHWKSSDNSIVEIKEANKSTATVEGLRAGENYTFIYSLSAGACAQFSEDTLTVTIKPQSESYAGQDVKICDANSFALNAKEVSPLKGLWTQSVLQEAAGVKILSPEKINTPVSGLKAGNKYSFIWTVTGDCGVSSDEVEIVFSQKNPFAGEDKSVCLKDGKIQLDAEPVNEGSTARWKTNSQGAKFSEIASASAFVTGLSGGEHTFIWEVDEGICGALSRDTVSIKVLTPPQLKRDTFTMGFNTFLNAPLSITANKEERLSYNLLSKPFRGEAKINPSGILEYKPNALFKGDELLIYQVCNINCGCNTGEVFIKIGDDKACIVPSIITPNGDGVNDVFAIPCLFGDKFPDNKVTIYNRRGDIVFQSQGPYQNDWGGKYSEVALPGGTYFFVVDFGNGEKPQSSFLIIQY
jgi:gliding motility-associated-like protein